MGGGVEREGDRGTREEKEEQEEEQVEEEEVTVRALIDILSSVPCA